MEDFQELAIGNNYQKNIHSYDNKLIEIRNPDAPIAPSLIKPEKKYNFQYGKADANDIQDFKKRMSEKYNRDRFNLPKKDNGNGGSFSMFNQIFETEKYLNNI